MYAAGLDTIFARDLAFAWTDYDPAKGYTPTTGNAQAADDLERAGIPTVMFVEELRKLGLWDEAWITEPVRITPAGTPDRPYLFEKSVAVWFEAPFLEGAEIHYTLDGGEPTASSPRFAAPINLADTTTLRTAAFRDGRKVSLDGGGYFVRLPPYAAQARRAARRAHAGPRSLRQIEPDICGLPVATEKGHFLRRPTAANPQCAVMRRATACGRPPTCVTT